MGLTSQEKKIFEQWLIENIDETIVPADEGNGDALLYNLVHLLRGDKEKYDYQPRQNNELESWRNK